MPAMEAAIERRMKRWQDQRWLLDVVVQTVGIEWDQRRIGYTLGPCGPEATADFNGVRARTKRFNDASREFRRAAVRRENKARQHEAEGHLVAAGESYFIASLLYGSAQWPIFAHTPENERLGDKKVECYTSTPSTPTTRSGGWTYPSRTAPFPHGCICPTFPTARPRPTAAGAGCPA